MLAPFARSFTVPGSRALSPSYGGSSSTVIYSPAANSDCGSVNYIVPEQALPIDFANSGGIAGGTTISAGVNISTDNMYYVGFIDFSSIPAFAVLQAATLQIRTTSYLVATDRYISMHKGPLPTPTMDVVAPASDVAPVEFGGTATTMTARILTGITGTGTTTYDVKALIEEVAAAPGFAFPAKLRFYFFTLQPEAYEFIGWGIAGQQHGTAAYRPTLTLTTTL